MAVGPFNIYSETLEAMLKSSFVDLSSQNMVAVLLTSSHTPDLEAHATYADISTQEVADADYAAQDLTGEVVTDETAGAYFDSGDICRDYSRCDVRFQALWSAGSGPDDHRIVGDGSLARPKMYTSWSNAWSSDCHGD